MPGFKKGSGEGWVTAEYAMLPRATVERTSRERNGPGGRTQEIQRLIGRSLRAAMATMAFGEHTIRIDCDVLQADGGTRTASITGGCVALADACAWLAERTGVPSPFGRLVAAVSVGRGRGRGAARPRLPRGPGRARGCQRRHAGAGPLRGGAGHRRARHLLPRPARRPARSGGERASPSSSAPSGRCSAGEAAGRHAERGEAARDSPDPRARWASRWSSRTMSASGRPGPRTRLELAETFEGNARRKAEYFARLSGLAHRRRRLRARGVLPGRRARRPLAALGRAPRAARTRWTRPTTPSCCGGCAGRPRPRRRARYRCVLVLLREPVGGARGVRGRRAAAGSSRRRAGSGGFGYDPLFFSDELGQHASARRRPRRRTP